MRLLRLLVLWPPFRTLRDWVFQYPGVEIRLGAQRAEIRLAGQRAEIRTVGHPAHIRVQEFGK
jgi:hypothetical protein